MLRLFYHNKVVQIYTFKMKGMITKFYLKYGTQFLASLAASFGYFVTGTVNGWSGSTLTKLNEDFSMGPTENSLVVSINSIGAALGCSAVGHVADMIGRRKVLLSSEPLLVLGWLLTGVAPNIYLIYCGRFLTGLATGAILASSSIYIGEICQPEVRGRLSSLSTLFLSIGILVTYVIGSYTPWRTSCYLLSIPPVIFFFSMHVAPESPYWYLLKGRKDDALKSLTILRNSSESEIQLELEEILNKLESVTENVSYRELLKPRTRKPMGIALFTHTIQQFCGANILMTFTSQIYLAAKLSVNIELVTVLTGVVQVVGTLISMIFIDRLGRKVLLSLSAIGIGFFTSILGGYFLTLELQLQWPTVLPVVSILFAILTYSIGCRPVPWLISAEVFNTKIRSRANSVCHLYNRILSVMLLQAYPYAAYYFGNAAVFSFFGLTSLIFGLFVYKIIPETKGKTLEQIQDYFEGDPSNTKTDMTDIKSYKEQMQTDKLQLK